ncbi:protein of unknown function UPF0150 [Methanohalobium evestigatum Z-7303]|uniref:HicB-like antitoxin of toxin-antitoxin system domain-containing protein n=1 Tax=Methanohalobium evestigatum (strain ATCC BAA-1072 / DSM 3721 / NBRC 107634 / OCM 161 / Z-7303) TaxID=644295 RepID=D7E8M5_METEZ|nr:type II toxin-antitoxin system HicB family antitoxin [Methanohalobium evestigatum]ADI73696.1 protein of unknown function UPF0150 [Methanohalobium evestigatum Z-7303]
MQTNSKIQLPVTVHEENNGYLVKCPFFKDCEVRAETLDKALENIRDAIKTCIRDGNDYRIQKFCTIKKFHFRTVTIDEI